MADEGANRHAASRDHRRFNVTKRRTSSDVLKINVDKDVRASVLEDILPNLVTPHGVPTANVIASCNVLCSLSKRILLEASDLLESIFQCFLPCLLHHVRGVRISALRAIRYLVRSRSHFQFFLQLHLDYLVARSLDLSSDDRRIGIHNLGQNEGVHALRLVSHLSHVDPRCVPRTLVRPLVAVAKELKETQCNTPGPAGGPNSDEGDSEQTARGCLLVLTELALLNPDLIHECGGLSVLLEAVLNPCLASCPRIPESMLLALLHLLNLPRTRRHFPKSQYLEHLLSPLSSPSMYQLGVKNRKGSQETHLSEIRLACYALSSTLRSWSGLLYLCQPQSSGIKILTDILVVGPLQLQHQLLDLFYNLFLLRKPMDEDLWSFDAALASVDPQTLQPSWSLGDGFVAKEGLSLLSYKSVSKMNLIDNHLALLICVFFNGGLVQALCRLLVQSNNEEVCVKAGILLGELLHLSSVLLAPDHPVTLTANGALSLLLNHEGSRRVLHWLERVHWLKQQVPRASSPFLFYIVGSSCAPPAPVSAVSPVSGSMASAWPRNSSVASLGSPGLSATGLAGSGPRLHSRVCNSNSIGSSSGRLDPSSDQDRPRHGSLSSSSTKFAESLIDRAVAESKVLTTFGRSSGPPSHSSSPPASGLPPLGSDYTSPDSWDWDLLLCTIRSLLDYVSPTSSPPAAGVGPGPQTNQSHHSFAHHHLYNPHHHSHYAGGGGGGGGGSGSGGGPGWRLPSWDEPSRARFLRRLMAFFSLPPIVGSPAASRGHSNAFLNVHPALQRQSSFPISPGFFANRPVTWRWARQAATFATELFAFLAIYPSDSEPGQLLGDLLQDFAAALRAASPAAGDDVCALQHDAPLAPGQLERSCSHFLFLPVARLTWSDRGEQLLVVHGVTDALVQLVTFTKCALYVKLVISSLDYSRQGSLSRLLLDRATTASCDEARVFVAQFLRVLLRANLPFFGHWGMEMVYKQVHDAFPPVSREALATLQEACEEDAYLALLARLKPALLHQNFSGHAVACRLLGSLPEFNRLKLSNWIRPELEDWTADGRFVAPFVQHIEECLFEAMTSYSPPSYAGDDLDRLSSRRLKEVERCVLAPLHPFGALAKHKESFEFLRETEFLPIALQDLRNGCHTCQEVNPKRLLRLKAALWSLGQLSATVWGLDWLVESDGLGCFLDLACNAAVLSVRGHAFWCLGLVGSTSRGAELLHHLGWSVLRSNRLSKWPLQLPQWEFGAAPREALPVGLSGRFYLPRNSDASSAPGGRRETRTESMTSSCGSESRRSTFEPSLPVPGFSANGDWASWLGNGTTTVRSLGPEVPAGGSSSDMHVFATMSHHLRNRSALSTSGSVHELDNSMVTLEPFHTRRQNSAEAGSLSSLFNPSSTVTPGPTRLSQQQQQLEHDDSRRLKKHSSVVGVPVEYRGIALPLSCHALSTNLFTCDSLERGVTYELEEEESASQTSTESDSEAVGSVFGDEEPGSGFSASDGAKSKGEDSGEAAAVSEESMSSACTSDYFSRTRSGSVGPTAAPARRVGVAGRGPDLAVDTAGAEEEEDEEGDSGLEMHTPDLCLLCCCGRGPGRSFNEGMAEARREVLERVVKLMSHVHPRRHELALLSLRERHPDLLKDFCLFSEVALLLANYRFNRAARTFLQEVFLELETASLYKLAQTVLPPLSEESDEG